MKEIALFDLDGTLVDLKIDKADFEKCRSYWASYVARFGVTTELKPLLPELSRISRTPNGVPLKEAIQKSFDDLELACDYSCLGDLDAIVSEAHLQFRRLVLVTHNGSALWERLGQEHCWPHMFDVVVTRNDMSFFKPDPRACAAVLQELARMRDGNECWVIGNSSVDRELGINLRREYSNLVVRTIRVEPTCAVHLSQTDQLDVDINSVNQLLGLMQTAEA